MPLVIHVLGDRHECYFKNAGHTRFHHYLLYIANHSRWKSFVDFADQFVKHETFPVKHFHFNKI